MIKLDFARRAIEAYYEGKATLIEERPVKDPVTGISSPEWTVTLKDEPCRLSYVNSYTSGADPLPTAEQSVKLFIAPEVEISAGCRIDVEQHGVLARYNYVSHAARYCTHQEVWVKRLEGRKL